jgi:hypothetical protein
MGGDRIARDALTVGLVCDDPALDGVVRPQVAVDPRVVLASIRPDPPAQLPLGRRRSTS